MTVKNQMMKSSAGLLKTQRVKLEKEIKENIINRRRNVTRKTNVTPSKSKIPPPNFHNFFCCV